MCIRSTSRRSISFIVTFLEQDRVYKRLAVNDPAEFKKTGKLSLKGFTKSNCTNETAANSGTSSFLNVTDSTAAYQAAVAMQKARIMSMREIEVETMERLSLDWNRDEVEENLSERL